MQISQGSSSRVAVNWGLAVVSPSVGPGRSSPTTLSCREQHRYQLFRCGFGPFASRSSPAATPRASTWTPKPPSPTPGGPAASGNDPVRLGGAHPDRVGGRPTCSPGPHQPRRRRAAVRLPRDRQDPSRARLRQARRAQPRRTRCRRRPPLPRITIIDQPNNARGWTAASNGTLSEPHRSEAIIYFPFLSAWRESVGCQERQSRSGVHRQDGAHPAAV